MDLKNARGNKKVRLSVLILLVIIGLGFFYYGYKTDNKVAKIAGGAVAGIAGAGLGLEANNTDFDLKKLWETGSLKDSLLARDENNNLITDPNKICEASEKGFYNYNCKDFLTQAEAQKIYETCKERSGKEDVFGLDRNHNGIVCESLPKNKKIKK